MATAEELDSARAALIYERQMSESIQAELHERIEGLEGHLASVEKHMAFLETRGAHLATIEASLFWRGTRPLRRLAAATPAGVRRRLKRVARILLRRPTIDPSPAAPAADLPMIVPPGGGAAVSLESAKGFLHLQPLRVFRAPAGTPTVNVITDSVLPGSLFGGVATALILAGQLVDRVGGRLRVVTRTEEADAADVARVLRFSEVPADFEIETLLSGPRNEASVPMAPNDYFLTTSWWSAAPTVAAIGHPRVVHLLQEDERMFYPMGDEYLRCAEVIADPGLRSVINSQMLFRHLTSGPDPLPSLAPRSIVFEPAFPASLFYDDPEARAASGKRNFLFYARPHNMRNLYWRGMQVIERAILDGILDPEEWRFLFLGKDLPPTFQLPGNPEVAVAQNLTLHDYAAQVRTAHVALSLIYSPHPSYPPLDLAASGSVVVTNTFEPAKVDLTPYSRNIFCAPPTVADLTAAIASAVALAADAETRAKNVADSGIRRDWPSTLAPVVDQILEWCDGRPAGG
jgi:hypothetical protein